MDGQKGTPASIYSGFNPNSCSSLGTQSGRVVVEVVEVVAVVVVVVGAVVVVVRAVVVVAMVVLGASVQLKTPNGAAAKSGMSPLHVSKFCTVIRTICASTTLENTQIGSSPLHVMPLHSLPFVLLHST